MTPSPDGPTPSRYKWSFRGIHFDFYRLCEIIGLTSAPAQHAMKKIIRAGKSIKPIEQEIDEAIASLLRWKEMLAEDRGEIAPLGLMNCSLCGEFRGHGHKCTPTAATPVPSIPLSKRLIVTENNGEDTWIFIRPKFDQVQSGNENLRLRLKISGSETADIVEQLKHQLSRIDIGDPVFVSDKDGCWPEEYPTDE